MANSFHKHERLCSKKQIEYLFKEGKSKSAYPVKLIYVAFPDDPNPQIKAMFVAPKKKFRDAHQRNKLKRRMREAYRLQKTTFYEGRTQEVALHLAFVYIGSEAQPYDAIYKAIQKLLTNL
ncbi:MAG: ribonuclease P protein component [Bacteroidia bacterium]|nr:ribonuclease P protein component [Bacteroidia bacterium]